MAKRGSANRKVSRHFFHEGRCPPVLLQVNGCAYTGELLDHSLVGVGISLATTLPQIEAGQIAENLYIGKPNEECRLREFVVANVSVDERKGQTYVGLYSESEEEKKKLFGIVGREVVPVRDPNSKNNFRPDKFPALQDIPHYSEEAVQQRREWLASVWRTPIVHLADNKIDPATLAGNIENYIGAVQIPVGLAGPVLVKGMYANGYIPVPMATTEGALVASVCRGARICALSGGIKTHVLQQVMSRAPIFFCETLEGAINLEKWILGNRDRIAARAESFSSVAKLTNLKTFVFGNCLHLHFFYSTGDAAGQNMTTACTFMACEWISEYVKNDKSIGFCDYRIEGNHSGDKKANVGNFINGRGIAVYAETHISHEALEKYLRTTARRMVRLGAQGEIAAMRLGMLGCNVNYANVVGAIFAAAGQDIASVYESATGVVKFEETDAGLKVSAYLPSLVIGTVGGGTALPTQKEALQLMNCYGAGNSFRLAEIVAATCLSLDLSTLGAIDANEFAQAHERLGRNRPEKYLAKADLVPKFFEDCLSDTSLAVEHIEPLQIDSKQGATSGIFSSRRTGATGIFRYDLTFRKKVPNKGEKESKTWQEKAVLKLKSSSSEIQGLGIAVARLSGDETLPGLMEANHEVLGFLNCDVREIEIFEFLQKENIPYIPKMFGRKIDERRSIFALLMEDLTTCNFMNTVDTPEKWQDSEIKSVLSAIAEIHSRYMNNHDGIPKSAKLLKSLGTALQNSGVFLERMSEWNADRNSKWISSPLKKNLLNFCENIKAHVKVMSKAPQTLTHNDCNPRNICIRANGTPLFYDWELCAFQNPQSDVAEFLLFVLDGKDVAEGFFAYVNYYKECLRRNDVAFDDKEFMVVLRLNVLKLCAVRFNLYSLVAPMMNFHFLPRLWRNSEKVLEKMD